MAVLSQAVADDTLAVAAVQAESTPLKTASEGSKSTDPCRHEHKWHATETAEEDAPPAIDFDSRTISGFVTPNC